MEHSKRSRVKFSTCPIPDLWLPVTMKEAVKALYRRMPIWQITDIESMMFAPRVYPDNVSRALVSEADAMPPEEGGGPDIFGIEWEYIPVAGGSMVRPGKPLLADANEWEKRVVWPDIDSWDWESSSRKTPHFLITTNTMSAGSRRLVRALDHLHGF